MPHICFILLSYTCVCNSNKTQLFFTKSLLLSSIYLSFLLLLPHFSRPSTDHIFGFLHFCVFIYFLFLWHNNQQQKSLHWKVYKKKRQERKKRSTTNKWINKRLHFDFCFVYCGFCRPIFTGTLRRRNHNFCFIKFIKWRKIVAVYRPWIWGAPLPRRRERCVYVPFR